MSAAEAPKSEQIQANVAAALSRLRGELGAASSPVAGTAKNLVPKTPSEPVEPTLNPLNFTVTPLNPSSLGPLPAGPVRPVDTERSATVVRPFEPTIAAAMAPLPAAHNEDTPPAEPAPMLAGGRREPSLSAERAAKSDADLQPDLLSGMEVPPAPPPPLGAFESEDEVGGRGKRMRNRILVLLALAIIAGGGAWAYIAKHRAQGPVPVISADSTPEKVKPADEGGMQVPNQNVQILDNMDTGKASSANAETVLPAPEQPLAPPAADTSNSVATQADAGAATSNTTTTAAPTNAPTVTEQPTAPVVPAPAIPNASTPAPSAPAATAPATTQNTAVTQPAPQASGVDSNGKLTLVAPQTQQAAPQPSGATAAPTPAPTPQAAAPVPAPTQTQTAAAPSAPAPTPTLTTGSARVQLAAVKSVALAKAQWAKMQKAYPDLLGALTLNIEKVERNGGTLYRIQAGPLADKAAAKDLCAKLAAHKQACIVPPK